MKHIKHNFYIHKNICFEFKKMEKIGLKKFQLANIIFYYLRSTYTIIYFLFFMSNQKEKLFSKKKLYNICLYQSIIINLKKQFPRSRIYGCRLISFPLNLKIIIRTIIIFIRKCLKYYLKKHCTLHQSLNSSASASFPDAFSS